MKNGEYTEKELVQEPKDGTDPSDQRAGSGKGKSRGKQHLPVVGLGASAGGLEALKVFFAQVPPDSGMSYIVLVHMSPEHPSVMHELLQKTTRAKVQTAENETVLQPDNVYVVPPKKEIIIYQGVIQLLDPVDKKNYLPIDFFFRSLAVDQGSLAVAVILSGTGTDGTVGLKEIKANEGLVLVQSEDTAKYAGMPRSAINTGQADMILPPEDMPAKLQQYFEHHLYSKEKTKEVKAVEKDWLNKIFSLLRVQLGHDFSYYKKTTLLRRIDRRMGLNQIHDHDVYVRYLRENPQEMKLLFHELLIGVTNFFRDPQSYEILKNDVLPDMIQSMDDGDTFRAWIPGCSSGEEVYSLAIVLAECLERTSKRISLQLFGTDIDAVAIAKARHGAYPSSIGADVSQERLNRFFFSEAKDVYRIRKGIRDTVVFSVQDVLRDPPFSRLSLLTCRNLLIYLNSDAQKKLLPLFHYTLLQGGILMLGSSETVGEFTSLFQPVNNTWKIYRRKEVHYSRMQPVDFPTGMPRESPHPQESIKKEKSPRENNESRARKAILARFAPSAVLVDNSGNILHVVGKTGKYLETPSGPPSHNILDMTREGLRIELASALRRARTRNEYVFLKKVRVRVNGEKQPINLHVFPLDKSKESPGDFMVAFEEVMEAEPVEAVDENKETFASSYESHIAELEQELLNARENHKTAVEELESSNEELKSTNEELQSSNEELQSTNEEMESSKEELQSLNEELQTVNSELQSKVEELSAAQDDINHLLNSTEIAIIFVDEKLCIKRFSKETTKIINLIGTDIGRPLEHQGTQLKYGNMIQDIQAVLDKLIPVEKEVQSTDGTWYKMSIKPYRTMDQRILGAVLTFEDVDTQKKYQENLEKLNAEAEAAWMLVRAIFDMNSSPMAVLDARGSLIIANTAFGRFMGIDQNEIEGRDFLTVAAGDIMKNSDLQTRFQTALDKGKDFNTRKFDVTRNNEQQKFIVQGRVIGLKNDQPYRILLSFIQQ